MRQRLFFATALLLTAAAGAQALQEPPAGSGQPLVRTDFDVLIERMFERHGGAERVEQLTGLTFRLTPVELSTDENGEPLEVALEPLDCEVDLGLDRRVRLEETLEGKRFVKLANPEGIQVFMDGKLQTLDALEAAAQEQAVTILRHLDVVYGALTGHLRVAPGKERTRDGVTYRTVEGLLAPIANEAPPRVLLYVHPVELTVHRYDLYDQDNRRQATLVLSDFVDLGGFPVASKITFYNRQREAYLAWNLEGLEAPEEIDLERFLRP